MSTVTLQLGQCGNQLGAEVFSRLHCESEAAPSSLGESIKKVFFREARQARGTDNRKEVPTLARAVLVDTEPRVVQRCLEGNEGDARPWRYAAPQVIHHAGGAANNWACGYNIHGPALQEKVLERVQREVECCDHLGGFLALHSVAGGTGSGLGSFILGAVRDAFPSAMLSSVSVWPFQGGEVSVQCYNATLTLSSIYEHADLSMICENERYLDLCRILLGQERPSLDSLNSAIAGNLVRVMMPCGSVRKLYGPGCPFLQLAGHLAPHPLYRLTTVRTLPQIRKGAEAFTCESWTALQRRMLHLCENASMVDGPSAGTTEVRAVSRNHMISASMFLWGNAASEASLEPLRKMPLWQHSVDGMQVHSDGHTVGGLERSLGIISNCQAVLPALASTSSRATSMLRVSAYLHQYERYGLSYEEMSEAILGLLQAQHDYEQLSADWLHSHHSEIAVGCGKNDVPICLWIHAVGVDI